MWKILPVKTEGKSRRRFLFYLIRRHRALRAPMLLTYRDYYRAIEIYASIYLAGLELLARTRHETKETRKKISMFLYLVMFFFFFTHRARARSCKQCKRLLCHHSAYLLRSKRNAQETDRLLLQYFVIILIAGVKFLNIAAFLQRTRTHIRISAFDSAFVSLSTCNNLRIANSEGGEKRRGERGEGAIFPR